MPEDLQALLAPRHRRRQKATYDLHAQLVRAIDAKKAGAPLSDAALAAVVERHADAFLDLVVREIHRPPIVALCGSVRFLDVFQRVGLEESLAGKIVLGLSVSTREQQEVLNAAHPHVAANTKREIDRLHLAKIDLADEVLILNVGGYIGESTADELDYARMRRKVIRYLEQPPVPSQTPAATDQVAAAPARQLV